MVCLFICVLVSLFVCCFHSWQIRKISFRFPPSSSSSSSSILGTQHPEGHRSSMRPPFSPSPAQTVAVEPNMLHFTCSWSNMFLQQSRYLYNDIYIYFRHDSVNFPCVSLFLIHAFFFTQPNRIPRFEAFRDDELVPACSEMSRMVRKGPWMTNEPQRRRQSGPVTLVTLTKNSLDIINSLWHTNNRRNKQTHHV